MIRKRLNAPNQAVGRSGHRRTECCCATQLNVPTSGRVLGLCAQDPREGGKGLREPQRGAGSYSRRDRSVRPGTGHHHARDGHTAEKTRAGARVRGTGDPRHRCPDPKVGPISGSYREMADEARRATSILRMYVAEILVPCRDTRLGAHREAWRATSMH